MVSPHYPQQIVSYYRANGRILTRQEYNVSQSPTGYQHRPEGRELFYAYDGLGSVVALSNHQGLQNTRYHYDAFGKVIDGDLTENQYTFTGRQLDPESGLYHFHFRQYDAEAGVWTTPDPIGVLGGVNLYGYVHNNPVNKIDFLGLDEPGNGFGPDGTGMSDTDSSVDTGDIDTSSIPSAGELGIGNPGSYGGTNTQKSMYGSNGLGTGNDPNNEYGVGYASVGNRNNNLLAALSFASRAALKIVGYGIKTGLKDTLSTLAFAMGLAPKNPKAISAVSTAHSLLGVSTTIDDVINLSKEIENLRDEVFGGNCEK